MPLSILATYSAFFHDLDNHCTFEESESEYLKFDLTDTDPRTFNRFTIWLYYQGIFVDEDISEPLEYYYQFLDLWAIADRYRVPQLLRQAADATIKLLRYLVERTDFDVLTYWRDAYDCSPVGSSERRFIAGQCAVLLMAGQEASFDPDTVHPALRGVIVSVAHDLYPHLF